RRYCRRRGMPILSTCHTHYEMYLKEYLPLMPKGLGEIGMRLWIRSVYARDDLIVIPSRNIRDVMLGYGLDSEYVVIPTGVDERIFHPLPEEARAFRKKMAESHPGFDKGPLLIYVGRIRHEKNLNLLAEAMVRIAGELPDTRLLMVGEGPLKAELQGFFHSKGLEGKVAWSDYLPREQLPTVYSTADIFVFPSKTETQGLVTIEAMLCGTPVVGVNRMGTAEILEGDTGGLLADDDPDDFADKVLRLLCNADLRKAKAEQARQHARNWSIDSACDKIENLYIRLFNEARNTSH
ncbi:MAG: glycosyltransferase, partial [Spirochaetes bacterium]|nr:glycosyltransferase [Spirochaetota bacterium]